MTFWSFTKLRLLTSGSQVSDVPLEAFEYIILISPSVETGLSGYLVHL